MISLEKVSLAYHADQPVLRDVSLSLPRGSFHFLGGASGAGKSTLMSLIALMRRPTSGKIRMFGIDTSVQPREALPPLRRRVGVVYQDFRLLDHLNVEENIALPLKVNGESRPHIMAKTREMVEWVGLKDVAKALPATLSGGQKQRVAIARAVICNPDIILADEPSGNLDRSLSHRFMHLFTELHKQGTTVLYATHDEELIRHFEHPVLRLEKGRVLEPA
jgi:cell division transport system ATP-binding protein